MPRRRSPRPSGPATAGPPATWPRTWPRSRDESALHRNTFEHCRPILEQKCRVDRLYRSSSREPLNDRTNHNPLCREQRSCVLRTRHARRNRLPAEYITPCPVHTPEKTWHEHSPQQLYPKFYAGLGRWLLLCSCWQGFSVAEENLRWPSRKRRRCRLPQPSRSASSLHQSQ